MPFAQFLAMKDAIVQHNQCIFELRSLLPDLLHRNIYDPVWIEKQLRHHALQTQQKVTKVAKLEAKKLAKGQ
jgi:hypothetical protein